MRDGRLYARGAADDKGNFWPLLHAACDLARRGELPVNVRVVIEGEEEAGSESITGWIRADERGADAAIVFDSGMVDERTPAITLGLRGMVMAQIEVRTGIRDLHSGIYGGSVLNALHVLHHMLAEVVPGARRRAARRAARGRPPARRGRARSRGSACRPASRCSPRSAAEPAYPGAAAEYYERNGADASLEVNEIVGGEPRTLVPAVARARSRCGSRPASAQLRWARRSSGCCATPRRPTPT